MTQAGPVPERKRVTLARDLQEFLIELSIAVHRFAMYPASHPSLTPAVENVAARLGQIFVTRDSVSIGVAQQQLVIEGVGTDPRHPVLSDLARRLHEQQLGGLSLGKGTQAAEIEALSRLLGRANDQESEPVGLWPPERLPRWEHVRVYPLGYDRLEMKAEGEAEKEDVARVTQLWLGLAQSALASDEPFAPTANPDPKLLAQAIEGHRRESAYDQVVVGYLLQLAEELTTGDGGAESEKVRGRVSTLVQDLGAETLTRLVAMGGNNTQRGRFLLDANQNLSVDAVVKVLHAAADASSQTISSSLTRLLSKLAAHAETGTDRMRAQADTALRENVEELIADWKLSDPNPDQYTAVLDAIARSNPLFETRVDRSEGLSGPHRVVQMAIEIGAWGPTVETAIGDLIRGGEGTALVQMVDQAAPGSIVADRVRSHLAQPSRLRQMLEDRSIDDATLRSLIDRIGESAAIPSLLDVLAESDSRSVRRRVFDQLLRMGPEVGERAVERLADGRWFVLRNMLVLLQRLETLPPGFDPSRLLEHPDERVRREAIPIALRKGAGRERVVAAALSDQDERTVRMALLALENDLPETLVPVLVNRVIKSQRTPEIRALAARTLGGSRSALALEVLIELATGGRSLLGKPRLADKSPEVLAALETLARGWEGEARAQEVLALAARAKDPELRQAAGGAA